MPSKETSEKKARIKKNNEKRKPEEKKAIENDTSPFKITFD